MKKIIILGIVFLFVGLGSQQAFANNIENNPPDEPGDPYPPGGPVPICVNLSWTCEDPDGDNVTFDVWFGDHPEFNIQQIVWNQTENWFWIYDLDFSKTYYWYVVAWDEYGAYTVGPLWNFYTEANLPPNPALDPYPPDGDPAGPIDGVLCWNGSDPNLCDILRYDVYFDDVNPPLTKRVSEFYEECWEITFNLTKYKTYYWRVDTYDREDLFTVGFVWHFYTGDNNPPTDPIIDGPKTGKKNMDYEFTFMSTDPEFHDIFYRVKWGDGTEDTTELYPNGTKITLSHSWDTVGDKKIQAKAFDEHGADSEWSTFTFVVSRDKVFNLELFELLFARFQYVIPILQKLIQQLGLY